MLRYVCEGEFGSPGSVGIPEMLRCSSRDACDYGYHESYLKKATNIELIRKRILSWDKPFRQRCAATGHSDPSIITKFMVSQVPKMLKGESDSRSRL